MQPHVLKTFVSNRAAKIQSLCSNSQWRNVSSEGNPADVLSRGADDRYLRDNDLWWQGPEFLLHDSGESRIWVLGLRSPNFGGLWEAGVKSFKYHLKCTIGLYKVTIEEFNTIIIQIEGILNSRPLNPLSSDINEYEVLTPSHFLIGRPVTAIPEQEIINISDNKLSRWQQLTKFTQIIWRKWQREYLNHLQQRYKWQLKKYNL
ncbi:hypothetical protein AVEN_153818-1 [Araneus ventricosus]|uniref:DUF5641 domain-containing protein n=1 Tax=Araneus ventricosus TaxID=182803 RepID=A0A4Y2LQM3_ARAVE|nr:hypothetical protein AVEN_153818-1 [Araneus ventricosus]